MCCPDCDRLEAAYERLSEEYRARTVALDSAAFSNDAELYQRLRASADDAQIEAEIARLLLSNHRRSHTG